MKSKDVMLRFTIDQLTDRNVRYEMHRFPSGAIMVDIWVKNDFFVLQFLDEYIGVSKIDADHPGFDTRPDEIVYDEDTYKMKLEAILSGDAIHRLSKRGFRSREMSRLTKYFFVLVSVSLLFVFLTYFCIRGASGGDIFLHF